MIDIFKIQNFVHIKLVYLSIHLGLVSFPSVVFCHFSKKKRAYAFLIPRQSIIFFLNCFGMSSITFLINYSFSFRDIIVFLLLNLLLATLLDYLKPLLFFFFGQLILLISLETSTSSENNENLALPFQNLYFTFLFLNVSTRTATIILSISETNGIFFLFLASIRMIILSDKCNIYCKFLL